MHFFSMQHPFRCNFVRNTFNVTVTLGSCIIRETTSTNIQVSGLTIQSHEAVSFKISAFVLQKHFQDRNLDTEDFEMSELQTPVGLKIIQRYCPSIKHTLSPFSIYLRLAVLTAANEQEFMFISSQSYHLINSNLM